MMKVEKGLYASRLERPKGPAGFFTLAGRGEGLLFISHPLSDPGGPSRQRNNQISRSRIRNAPATADITATAMYWVLGSVVGIEYETDREFRLKKTTQQCARNRKLTFHAKGVLD